LVGNPKLLFLDEPTTGLDPASRRQLWGIIQQFRDEGRTVLLTTHYMDEAEKLCDRVAIFDRGQIITQGKPQELIRQLGGDHVLELALEFGQNEEDEVTRQLEELPAVSKVALRDQRFSLSTTDPHAALPGLSALLDQRGWRLVSLVTRQATLEDVFVAHVGHSLESSAA
jgi:ABC-2 type transport system ATP-binding protein